MKKDILILKILEEEDLPEIIRTFNFPWKTLEATKEKWKRYYLEQKRHERIVCLAKIENTYIGYGSLLKKSEYPYFREHGIPEIHDVWISNEYRRNGLGRRLIQHIEEIAYNHQYKEIGLGVGLYEDYGIAQRLYSQMDYIPDGRGITYKYQLVVPGDSYPVDDDLIIWLKKNLS